LSVSSLKNESVSLRPATKGLHSLSRTLLYGSATLGVAVALERLLGFLSGVLAARVAGPQTFGAYSMVLATAGTVAAYAGAGIGTTATRFSGQYRPDSNGYRKFIIALAVIAAASAGVAAVLMFAGAIPLARWVLRNPGLISFLRIAAVSSAAIVLLECMRGVLVGQQKFQALLVLSSVFGICLLIVLPLAARISAGMMIASQGSIALIAVVVCLALSRRFGLRPVQNQDGNSGPGILPILKFGLVQFSAFAGISIASWWIASLVARSDVTLTQMGLYAIANQFRGLAVLAPNLCAQVGYSLMTEESGSKYGGAGRVMLTNSFLAALMATLIAGAGIVFAPLLLVIIYGRSFTSAEAAVSILLATGILHMTGLPAAQRLSIVGLRTTGVINAVWAILLAAFGVLLIPKAGAAGAALAFLISHTVSQLLVIMALSRLGDLPKGYVRLFTVTLVGTLLLGGLGYWRAEGNGQSALTVALFLVLISAVAAISFVGRSAGCLPKWRSSRLRFNDGAQSDLAHS
jgi:O-antigen/teichoic acid export membrane protein